ncbi:ATP-binding cassette domain-containing protein [Streptomyces sp. NPDC050095]|uniref:ATP-binding cassette domain-containing protein n=1 Tax=unclassified Streptomyces TaxID=2593676 RepID=UPI003425E290
MTSDGPTVAVRDLTVRYRSRLAVNSVSMSLRGGVTGLLGPNGAGKTTLLRTLATAHSADSGDVEVLGLDPRQPQQRTQIRRNLGYLPQSPGFHPHFTAFEFVDYVAILREYTNRAERHSEVRRVLSEVGLSEDRGRKTKSLSGGMRQRLALAAALLGSPQLLILDEPTVGLDPEQRLRFRELVADLGAGRTVLLSTHQTEDVTALCNRVIVLDRGAVKFDGTPDDLSQVAHGRVWLSDHRSAQAVAGWLTGRGTYRNIGTPPSGAELVAPTLEDGYLLLLDSVPENREVSAA